MLDHFPLARDELQGLGHVFADLSNPAAAARAGRRHRINDTLARQMLWQRPACRPTAFKRRYRNLLGRCRGCRHPRCRLRLRGILFQIGELKLKLIEQRATFRGLAELLVP